MELLVGLSIAFLLMWVRSDLELGAITGTTHIWGEMEPIMNPVRWAFWMMGSSDLPRRLMSVTRWVRGSQLTPYQPLQYSGPDHKLKRPRWGAFRAARNASSAARSDGLHCITIMQDYYFSFHLFLRCVIPINY